MNMKHALNKVSAMLAAVVAVAFAATPGHAAFTSIAKSTITASVSLSGTGTVSMSAPVLKFVANNALNSGSLGFGTVTLPVGFVGGDSYIQLASVITASNGGIQIYTDNTNASASPRFTVAPAAANPGGLVSANGLSALPMGWSVKSSTSTPPVVRSPNKSSQPVTDPNFEWQFFEDFKQVAAPGIAAFANGDPYITVKNAVGLQQNTGTFSLGGAVTGFIYPEADFTTASTPNTYGTNMITLEVFTQ